MKKGSTKRALVTSIVSTCASVTMLAGATFAWFTDTASTGVNKIQAGTLDVALVDANGNSVEGRDLNWKTADNREQSAILWEPGATYDLETVKVVNEGNLALKYKVLITGINGDAELNEAIEWEINGADIDEEYKLAKGEERDITISGTMKTSAGNEYQGKSIDGIGITVVATQDTVEKDSVDNNYDANAGFGDYIVAENNANAAALVNASEEKEVAISIAKNTSVSLETTGINTKKEVTFIGDDAETSKVVLKQNGYIGTSDSKLVFKNVTVECGTNDYKGIAHTESIVLEDCIIDGTFWGYAKNITFKNCTFNVSGDKYNIWTYTSNVNFENCKFNSDGKSVLIYNEGGSNPVVNLKGCEFTATKDVDKAAIEISGQFSTPTVTIENCKETGFSTKGLWFVKDNTKAPVVTVDGTQVN